MVLIHDPGNRLPSDHEELLKGIGHGLLLVPDRGVPIHPNSLRRLHRHARSNGIVAYEPEIPVSTALGLPRYRPLYYWVPTGSEWKLLLELRKAKALMNKVSALSFLSKYKPIQVTETSTEEQVHYFSSHFHSICPKPLQVSVIMSNTCNLKCVMCPYHSPLIRPTHKTPFFTGPQEYITWDLLDKIATQCGELRIPIKIGNVEEPLLHPKAVDFVKACRTRGAPSAHITTNGWPLTERKCRELLEAGLTSLYISVDAATPETYLKIRGGDLEKLEANVHTFLRVRKEMNADCRVMMSFVKNKGVSVEEAMQFREKWLPVTDGVIFYNLAEMVGGNSHYQEVNPIAKETLKKVNGRWPCLNPFQEMYILPDGRIYYCCETIAKLAFAELRSVGEFPEQSISDIWKGQLYQELRRDLILNKLDEQPACKDCGIWMAHASDSETKDGRKITWNMITELVEPVPKAA